jgi:ERCC4-type nuclease
MPRDMVVLIDKREQKPWKCFRRFAFATLKTGDYSIAGMERKVCIERKGSVTEFVLNLGKDWGRFERELKRMQGFAIKILVLEFSLSQLLRGSKYSILQPATILGKLSLIMADMQIPTFFVGSDARKVMPHILYRIWARKGR